MTAPAPKKPSSQPSPSDQVASPRTRSQFRAGGVMVRWVACGAALLMALPAVAKEARALIHVSVRVVHPVNVQVAIPQTAALRAPVAVRGGTEWRVPLEASAGGGSQAAGIRFQVKDCAGATATWSGAPGDTSGLRVFVPQGSDCAPVVVATVFPDGSPDGAQALRN